MHFRSIAPALFVLLVSLVVPALAGPNTLTYQGSVTNPDGTIIPGGNYRMRFGIFDAAVNGTKRWEEIEAAVPVSRGLFSVTLGDNVAFATLFQANANLWLEVALDLNKNGSFEPGEIYAPREKLAGAAWAMDADTLDGRHGGLFWWLTGNGGTNPAAHFLGTTDNQPLVIRVNGKRTLLLAPTSEGPNLIGGSEINATSPGVKGVTIAGGGSPNTGFGALPNKASGDYAFIGGGRDNQAGYHAVVAGGGSNAAPLQYASVGGGASNNAVGGFSAIAGGFGNVIFGDGSAVGGGVENQANNAAATVAGGFANVAAGFAAVVGGGGGNAADGTSSTVAGGSRNQAANDGDTVGGGQNNLASGTNATVPGGLANEASGASSFAAGRQAKAVNLGAFVWADSNAFNFSSGADNEFRVRATGGVRFISAIDGTGNPTAGVQLLPGQNTWVPFPSPSDRNVKSNFVAVDQREVLRRLQAIPISTWNYNYQDPSIRHIGPMAQDFHAAFGVGEDDRHIEQVDAMGVALAAVQGLQQTVEEKDAQLAAQQKRIGELEARLAAVEAALERLAGPRAGERR